MTADPAPALDGSALLVVDMQVGVLARYTKDVCGPLLERASEALEAARSRAVPVVYVRLGFRPSSLDVSSRNRLLYPLVRSQDFLEGSAGTSIHPHVVPASADPVIVKKRTSAFSGSDLAQVLSAMGTTHLILTGLTTSGAILSTLRDASDRDYAITLLSDACLDPDPEVHSVLCEKVFPKQATVTTVASWAHSLASGRADQTGGRVMK
jgi:nicotinamidase-related amidase